MRHRGLMQAAVAATMLVVGMAIFVVAPQAQDYKPDPTLAALGETIWKNTAPCRNCHGGLANGIGDMPQDPQGANLRQTKLAPAQILETIKCGRPGTEMPYFDGNAYTDKRCYGATAAELGNAVPPAGLAMSPRQIDALLAFIVTRFVGKPDPTFEDCIALWGAGATTCARYPQR